MNHALMLHDDPVALLFLLLSFLRFSLAALASCSIHSSISQPFIHDSFESDLIMEFLKVEFENYGKSFVEENSDFSIALTDTTELYKDGLKRSLADVQAMEDELRQKDLQIRELQAKLREAQGLLL